MRFTVLFIPLFLIACSAQKPVPVDQFYRLPDFSSSSESVVLSDQVIYVGIFETNGLHRERALIYSDKPQGLELKQYHYQHWIDSPTRMLRDSLVQFLRSKNAAPTVVTTVDPYPQIEIKGKIKRFDQIEKEDTTEVVVSLELRADMEGRLIHIQDYQAMEQSRSDSSTDLINAYHLALEQCFSRFVNDVKTAL